MDKEELLKTLIDKQRKNIPDEDRLEVKDIRRLVKFLQDTIFNEHGCTGWDGYYCKTFKKCTGITFFFKKEKRMIHRLLYINYKGDIPNNCFIRFTCPTGPYCCNVNHMNLKERVRKYARRKPPKIKSDVFQINYDITTNFD